jgi:Helix-turn-helix domain
MSDLELITAAEFARLRRCSLRTLDRERATGTGCPYVRLGGRVLYRRADIHRYIEQNVRGLKGGTE